MSGIQTYLLRKLYNACLFMSGYACQGKNLFFLNGRDEMIICRSPRRSPSQKQFHEFRKDEISARRHLEMVLEVESCQRTLKFIME